VRIDGLYVPGEGYYKTAPGTAVTKFHVIAGKGTKVEFRRAAFLSSVHGGRPENWQKMRGEVVLFDRGLYRRAEMHWAQEKTVGPIKEMFKHWLDKEWHQ
jgi:hypothetical protein